MMLSTRKGVQNSVNPSLSHPNLSNTSCQCFSVFAGGDLSQHHLSDCFVELEMDIIHFKLILTLMGVAGTRNE